MKSKILYISIAVGLSVAFFLLGWFLNQSSPISKLTANSKVETAKLNKDYPEFRILTNTYSTNANFVFLDEKGNVATTLSVSNTNIEPPSYRIVKGHTHDWFVVTRIESSGTGFMNHLDEWYTMLQDGTMGMVLSYPSDGLNLPNDSGKNEYWRTEVLNSNYTDDLAVDIKLTTKICDRDDKNCSETSKITHYVWDNEYEEFLAEIAGTNGITYEKGTTYKAPILNEYEKYVSGLRAVCPFESTASTGECLDNEISKQKQSYDSLLKELTVVARAKKTGKNGDGDVPLYMPFILNKLSEYTKTKDAYIEQMCSFRNSLELGTGIVEASRKCKMYYNVVDIQTIKGIIDELKHSIFPE